MSKYWTEEELHTASIDMKAVKHLGYDEFCEHLGKPSSQPTARPQILTLLRSVVHISAKKIRKAIARAFQSL
jgi:hypothetical protein